MGIKFLWKKGKKLKKQLSKSELLEELRFRRTPWYIGLAASIFGVTITHPLDLARVNIQANALEYSNSRDVIKFMVMNGGIRGLYYAFPSSVVKNLFQSSTLFLISHTVNKREKTLAVSDHVFISLLGGFVNSAIGTPFVKIGTIMQADLARASLPKRNFRNIIFGLYTLYKKGGWPYLYQGAALQFLYGSVIILGDLIAFDFIKNEMKKRHRELPRWKIEFISSTLASASVSLILMPSTLVRVIIMNADPGQYKSSWEVCKHLQKVRGNFAFTIGARITIYRIIPHSFLVAYAYDCLIKKFVKIQK